MPRDRQTRLTAAVLAMALALILTPAPASAYIDPGTGSFVIQGAIAVILGTGVAVKLYWKKIVGALTGKPPAGDHDDDDA
jgi:hypothetical protein